VSADGVPLGQVVLKDENGPFQYSLSFPDQLVGRKQLEMSIEVGHTFRVNGDGRDLGLAFSLIEIR
jgi:hypothetical protein